MGQKVNPVGFRLGIVKDHTSTWYADSKSYADKLLNDLEVREYLRKRLASASGDKGEHNRTVTLWDLASGRCAGRLLATPPAAGIAAGGSPSHAVLYLCAFVPFCGHAHS